MIFPSLKLKKNADNPDYTDKCQGSQCLGSINYYAKNSDVNDVNDVKVFAQLKPKKLKIPLNKTYAVSKDKRNWILQKYGKDYQFYTTLNLLLKSYANLGLLEDSNIITLQQLNRKLELIFDEIDMILLEAKRGNL